MSWVTNSLQPSTCRELGYGVITGFDIKLTTCSGFRCHLLAAISFSYGDLMKEHFLVMEIQQCFFTFSSKHSSTCELWYILLESPTYFLTTSTEEALWYPDMTLYALSHSSLVIWDSWVDGGGHPVVESTATLSAVNKYTFEVLILYLSINFRQKYCKLFPTACIQQLWLLVNFRFYIKNHMISLLKWCIDRD